MKKNTFLDCLITGEIVIIGLSEASHMAAVLFGLSFSDCARLLGISLGILLVVGAGLLSAGRRHIFGESGGKPSRDATEMVLYAIFALMAILQLIFIGMGHAIYREGDMTVETVESFLASDGVYRVNPLTGMPYELGMPLRLKILCLPTLYGSLCRWTGLPPAVMVQRIVPMAVLLSSYASFSLLGRAMFPEDGSKRACFLVLVSLLVWVGAYRYGMVGFGLLCCGWRGVAIRGGVLLPWLLSLCLRRKRAGILLCVLAEACIVWTLYGCGACLAVAAGMAAAGLACRKLPKMGAGLPAARGKEREDAK